MKDAQRLINVIRRSIEDRLGTVGAGNYRYGVAHEGGSAYEVSAYLDAEDVVTEYIRQNAGSYVSPGDYIIVIATGEGDVWIDQILPTSLYSKIAIDYNRGRIFIGDGESPPSDPGQAGQVLHSGGPDGSFYWDTVT